MWGWDGPSLGLSPSPGQLLGDVAVCDCGGGWGVTPQGRSGLPFLSHVLAAVSGCNEDRPSWASQSGDSPVPVPFLPGWRGRVNSIDINLRALLCAGTWSNKRAG